MPDLYKCNVTYEVDGSRYEFRHFQYPDSILFMWARSGLLDYEWENLARHVLDYELNYTPDTICIIVDGPGRVFKGSREFRTRVVMVPEVHLERK